MPLSFKHLVAQIVHHVLRKVCHVLDQLICCKNALLHIEFLRGLVQQPRLAQLSFDVLAIKEVAEHHLVFSEGTLREYQVERPLNLVLKTEGFETLHACVDLMWD